MRAKRLISRGMEFQFGNIKTLEMDGSGHPINALSNATEVHSENGQCDSVRILP